MNYYFDTEFLEGPQKKRILGVPYGKTKNTIDLVSIGIVCEDGREYYAISKDFNLKEAWNRYDLKPMSNKGGIGDTPTHKKVYWIRENVLRPIFDELLTEYNNEYSFNLKNRNVNIGAIINKKFSYKLLKFLINKYGKSNKQITEEIVQFCSPEIKRYNEFGEYTLTKPIFHAYYADYDWVVFCWLFGRMIDLPKGFPMYCVDIKQIMDEMYMLQENKYEGMTRLDAWNQDLTKHPKYPVNNNPHHALSDAKFDRDLHNFLNKTYEKIN